MKTIDFDKKIKTLVQQAIHGRWKVTRLLKTHQSEKT